MKYGSWIGLFAGLIVCIAPSLRAQSMVQASFDTTTVAVGDAVELRVIAFGTQPDTLLLNNWPTNWADSNVVTRSGWQRGAGTKQWRYRLQMVMLDSGQWHLPPVQIRNREGLFTASDSLLIEVLNIPITSTDPNDLADIKPIWREPARWTDYWWLIALLTIPLLGGLIWWAVLRYFNHKKLSHRLKASGMTAREWALRELDILAEKRLWQNGDVKAYHTELTQILRLFVQHEWNIPARYKTSTEIVQQFRQRQLLPEAQIVPLEAILNQADLVKFARNRPQATYHEQAMEVARLWINQQV
jgi:hypothetical protein